LGTTQATKFYVMTPLTDSALAPQPSVTPSDTLQRVVVALAPVDIPRYLDRPQIVTRVSPNELNLAEFDQWAEPLPDHITRVLAENLRRLLNPHGIDVSPDPSPNRPDYQVSVQIMRFEREADDGCVLQAGWALMDERDRSVRVQTRFDVSIPLEASGYNEIVGAMSRALGALSRDIALRLRAVVTHGGAG
jgi:uncharacterized lipoprotein YmbA